jgi:hypothetical protein
MERSCAVARKKDINSMILRYLLLYLHKHKGKGSAETESVEAPCLRALFV